MGPWIRDEEVSSKNSEDMISLDSNNVVVIKESGLYLIYAQVRIFVISLELSSSRPKDAIAGQRSCATRIHQKQYSI